MIWLKKICQNNKSHAKGRGFSWLMYLILISCSLTSVTLSKYTKTITATATGSIALFALDMEGSETAFGAGRMRSSYGDMETVTVDRLSDSGYYVFKVKNYNAQGVVTEVPLQYSIAVRGVDDTVLPDFQLYQTDADGNIAAEPMRPGEMVIMSIDEKQVDTYVIRFDVSMEDAVQVTVIAEQI